MQIQEYIRELNKAFDFSICLHPEANNQTCTTKSKAHTIPKNSSLVRIASGGKIYSFPTHISSMLKQANKIYPIQIGINEASTFKGFCNYHDNSAFREIDKGSFKLSAKNIFLMGYRSFCQEIYNKKVALNLLPYFRTLDRGKSENEQRRIQSSLDALELGLNSSTQRLIKYKQKYDFILQKGVFSRMSYLVVELQNTPSVQCSGAIQPEFDFQSNKLQDGRSIGMMDILNFSVLATESGGLVVFAWLDGLIASEQFVRSFLRLPKEDMSVATVVLSFEFLSNVYFAIDWWDKLDENQRDIIRKHVLSGILGQRNPSSLLINHEFRINWSVGSLTTNLK